MKSIIIAVISIVVLASCGSEPTPLSTQKFKTKRIVDGRVTVRELDTMYTIGDTIQFTNEMAREVIIADRSGAVFIADPRDYQLQVNEETIEMWDGNRLVQVLEYRDEDNLSLAIWHDNQ